MISVSASAHFIQGTLAEKTPPVGLYWYTCDRSRSGVRRDLLAAASEFVVLPLIVTAGFDNPNSMAADLSRLLESERAQIEGEVSDAETQHKAIAVVLLSRTWLQAPLIGSPVTMPTWFPYCGGRIVAVDLCDIVSEATSSITSCPDEIRRLRLTLYEVEGLLLQRLEDTQATRQNEAMGFFQALLGDDRKPSHFLAQAKRLHSCQLREDFRVVTHPDGQQLLGRITYTVSTLSPEQLPKFGTHFIRALRLDGSFFETASEPFLTVAFRSTNADQERSRDQRFPRNVLLTMYAAAQLVTASHHASEYGEFPIIAMTVTFFELQSGLNDFKNLIASKAS